MQSDAEFPPARPGATDRAPAWALRDTGSECWQPPAARGAGQRLRTRSSCARGPARSTRLRSRSGYSLHMEGGLEYDTHQLRYVYQSPRRRGRPSTTTSVSRERVLRKTQEIPSGPRSARYETGGCTPRASDGRCADHVLMLKGTALDGSAPLMVLRLRLVRLPAGGQLLDPQPVAGRPRLDLGAAHTAVAPTRAGAGFWTASASPRRTPSATSLP